MEKVGQLSEDGKYYWDSQQWVPAFSRDGNWRWDGRVWVPADPPNIVPPRGSTRWFRQLLGFRSLSPWKMVVALVGYSAIALLIAWGLAPASWDKLAIGLGALAAVLIAGNRGLRQRLPLFRSNDKCRVALAWAVLALMVVVTVFIATRPLAPRSSGVVQAQVTRPTDSPSPSPIAASPSPSPVLPSPLTQRPKPNTPPIVVPRPTPRPSPSPSPSPTTCGAPANPFGYDFCLPADVIFQPAPAFCAYFKCVAGFWSNATGYVDECADQTYSHSGGQPGNCSLHGGRLRPLYS